METQIKNFILYFSSILWEAMPFIVLGAVIAGILEEMLPQGLVARILPRKRLLSILIGGLLGMIFPMCECGIVPVMRRLLRKGVPLSCCTAYLLAGPIINIVVILSTVVAFRPYDTGQYKLTDKSFSSLRNAKVPEAVLAKIEPLKNKDFDKKQFQEALAKVLDTDELEKHPIIVDQAAPSSEQMKQFQGQFSSTGMMLMRMILGYIIAVTTSLIVDFQYRKYGNALLNPLAHPSARDDTDDLPPFSWRAARAVFLAPFSRWFWMAVLAVILAPFYQRSRKRLSNITETALSDFVDITAFLVLGALLAAFVRVWLSHAAIAELAQQNIVPTILIMMVLAILLCLCSEADAFVAASFKTLPSAAKLAFLVLGPMMDLKLYMFYTRVFRPRLIITIFGAVMIQVFIWSLVVHYVWQNFLMAPGAEYAP